MPVATTLKWGALSASEQPCHRSPHFYLSLGPAAKVSTEAFEGKLINNGVLLRVGGLGGELRRWGDEERAGECTRRTAGRAAAGRQSVTGQAAATHLWLLILPRLLRAVIPSSESAGLPLRTQRSAAQPVWQLEKDGRKSDPSSAAHHGRVWLRENIQTTSHTKPQSYRNKPQSTIHPSHTRENLA